MKIQFSIIVAWLLFFMSSCSVIKTTTETITEVTRKVESKDFTIVFNYANPMCMRPVYLTSEYDLRFKNDSIFAYLPYYGVAHVAPLGNSDGGIKFSELVKDYKISTNKKSTGWDIHFKVKAKEAQYDCYLNIFYNGSSMLTVNSYERDMISFNGEMKLDLKK